MKGSLQYKCASAVIPQLDWEDTQRLYRDTNDAVMRFFVAHLKKELSKQTEDPEVLAWINNLKRVVVTRDTIIPRENISTLFIFDDDTKHYLDYSYILRGDNNIFHVGCSFSDDDHPMGIISFFDCYAINNDMLILYNVCFNMRLSDFPSLLKLPEFFK